jgi:hypothetical protein
VLSNSAATNGTRRVVGIEENGIVMAGYSLAAFEIGGLAAGFASTTSPSARRRSQ